MEESFIKNVHGRKQFRIVVTEQSRLTVNFDVFEVLSWSGEKPFEPLEEELYLKAYMKWDNCNHFWFGEDGYMHMCGGESMRQHLELMEFLYDYAFEFMEKENGEKLPKEYLSPIVKE